jgi:phosphatidylserine/phosphatidylglycerophosphate/cardiolipin synthase-like enzyme
VRPLAALLRQAHNPAGLADELFDVAAAAAAGDGDSSAVISLLSGAVRDRFLVWPTLVRCGVLTESGRLEHLGVTRLGQAAVLMESESESEFRLVLTVPGFLRPSLEQFVSEHGDAARPLETMTAIRETAASAGPRLQIAAPYLHTGFVGLLAPQVERVLDAGGQVQLVTRALSAKAPDRSSANVDAVKLLRQVADGKPGRLQVASWEETGLGIHFKVVLAHRESGRRAAYIGSSNLTPGGTLAQAEVGVLAEGPQVDALSKWLDLTVDELRRRRLPSA